jgi:hypothetical protein
VDRTAFGNSNERAQAESLCHLFLAAHGSEEFAVVSRLPKLVEQEFHRLHG